MAQDAPAVDTPRDMGSSGGAPRSRCNVLLASFTALFAIGFGVWLVSAGGRYRQEYADGTEGWRIGTTRVVELTLVRQDKQNLACASDQDAAGLRCGYRQDLRVAAGADDARVLQPYNTVHGELLLGAGLWSSAELKGPLPDQRFTVVCNYTVKGVFRSARIRFDPLAAFVPLGRTVTFGTLGGCVLPR